MVDELSWWSIAKDVPTAEGSTVSTLLTSDVLELLGHLSWRFCERRTDLLSEREARQARVDGGQVPAARAATRGVRRSAWTCRRGALAAAGALRALSPEAPQVPDGADVCGLLDLREGPAALAWVLPQLASREGAERLVVRIRGLHAAEPGVAVAGSAGSATLYDLAVLGFHAAASARDHGVAPCVMMPGLQSLEEAFWLRDVLCELERVLGLPEGSIRVVVSIETVPAAYEADEIVFALRDRAVGLRCAGLGEASVPHESHPGGAPLCERVAGVADRRRLIDVSGGASRHASVG